MPSSLWKPRGKTLADLADAYAHSLRLDENEEEIESAAFPEQSNSPVLSAQEAIDQTLRRENLLLLDDAARSLHAHIERTFRNLRKNNIAKAENLVEISLDVNHIEADRRLLQSERAQHDLLEFLLLVSLRWFYPRIQEERHRALIQQFGDSIEVALGRPAHETIGSE